MTIDRAKSRLAEAYQWLHDSRETTSHRSLYLLMRQIKTAQADRNYSKAQQLAEQVNELADKLENEAPSETNQCSMGLVECAYPLFEMGLGFEAVALLEKSLALCHQNDGGYFAATARWLLGCMQWELGEMTDAILSWEKSIEDYRKLRDRLSRYSSKATIEWYTNRISAMMSHMENALSDPGGTPPADPFDLSTAPVSPASRVDEYQQDLLQLFNVYNEVRAGPPGSTHGHGGLIGQIEVDRFQSDGRAYRMVNLRDSRRMIKYTPSQDLRVIRVVGDSMDAEGIDDCDYVLLRIQNAPENNDIVAAVIHDVDTTATLKKFIRKRDKILLRFRSHNPEYQINGRDKEYEFAPNDPGIEIVGVALAVFKPI